MWGRRLAAWTLSLCLFLLLINGTAGAAHAQVPLKLNVKSAILVDAHSGKILYSLNASQALPPASMTKMMTEYLVLEAVQQGKISWDQKVKISEAAASLEGSQVWLYPGEERTVKELFTAMAVYSANDATVALAELLGGNETEFVHMMNEKAKAMGMKNTHFVTSSGYPPEDMRPEFRPQIDGEHVMSAEDAAILARELILKQPKIFEFTTIPEAVFRQGEGKGEIRMQNWNWLIKPLIYAYEGADGLKTGNTEAAGFCITATAKRGEMRLIAVVMGAKTIKDRFTEVRKLLDWGFNHFTVKTVLKGKEPVEGFERAPLVKGKKREVEVVPQQNLSIVVPKGEEAAYKPEVVWDQKALTAPVEKQRVVGWLKLVREGGQPDAFLSNIPPQEQNGVAMIAQEDVKKAGFIRLFFRSIMDMVVGVFKGIAGDTSA
ncbi:MAG: hypothetical protein BAA01_03295 [Bacillus thermozeamaize]|uniref:serine-type D-Ala-D-Ala carboxypeptidase n=1 Tax=Bacillus thermozeamaize TaxID=230954 RepID=A0A1Y3PEP2_9BACI|nr:MAG: hypothetical protein BAA01_03295 [Bacillus thermozeamaize]